MPSWAYGWLMPTQFIFNRFLFGQETSLRFWQFWEMSPQKSVWMMKSTVNVTNLCWVSVGLSDTSQRLSLATIGVFVRIVLTKDTGIAGLAQISCADLAGQNFLSVFLVTTRRLDLCEWRLGKTSPILICSTSNMKWHMMQELFWILHP